MYRQTSKRKERICVECNEPFFHNSRRLCKNCRIKKIKIPRSWEDGLKVLSKAKNIRDQLAMHLQLYQGLREGELFGGDKGTPSTLKPLTVSQIDLVNNKIIIFGKGGTVEYIFLDKEAVKLLTEYLKYKRVGKDKPLIDLTCRRYFNIVKDAVYEAGLENPERFTTHTLRSISITHMYKKKGLIAAKNHARHISEKTTVTYIRLTTDERREDFNSVFEDT